MPESFFETLALFGAAAGALVALLTAIKLATAGLEYIASIPRRIRVWKAKSSYLLIPSIEEVAKYSLKIADRNFPTALEIEEATAIEISRKTEEILLERISLVRSGFAVIFFIFFIRTLHLGLVSQGLI